MGHRKVKELFKVSQLGRRGELSLCGPATQDRLWPLRGDMSRSLGWVVSVCDVERHLRNISVYNNINATI